MRTRASENRDDQSVLGATLLKSSATPQKPQHHGNLRDALLQAAIHLISETGPAVFTLREVARRPRVSHNAPYRHFQNREELLAAVATVS